jgi:hypothetical protein
MSQTGHPTGSTATQPFKLRIRQRLEQQYKPSSSHSGW